MKKIAISGLFHKKPLFNILVIIIGLCAFVPFPSYRPFVREHQTFTRNEDVMPVLKRSSWSQVQNDAAYFYFTDSSHFLAFRQLQLEGAHSVAIRYRAYPLNRRNLFARPAVNLSFEDRNNPGTFYGTRGLRGSFRTRTVRTAIPGDQNVHLYLSTDLGNIVDQYVLVIEDIMILNRSFPWWGIQEFFSNYRFLFLAVFSLCIAGIITGKSKKKNSLVLGVLILFLFLNAVPFERMSPYFADALEYQKWGRTMLYHGVIGPAPHVSSTHWPPLWPLILGVMEHLYSAAGSIVQLMTFIQVGIILFIYLLGARLFSRGVGLTAAVLFTLYPETIIRSKIFYSEPLFLLLTLSFLYFYLLLRENKRIRYLVLSLVSFLGALYTKQEILLLWFWIFPVELFLNRKNLKMYFFLTLLIILGCAPYIYRNYRVTGSFVFISSTFGQNLLMGNCPQIETLEYGPLNQPYPYGDTRYTPEQLQKIRQAGSAIEVNRLNTRFALEYLSQVNIPRHLSRKAGLYFLWQGYPYEMNLFLFSVPWVRFVLVIASGFIAFLFLLYKNAHRRDILLLTAGPVLMNTAIAMIFFLRAERHRYLAMPFLFLFIAALGFHLFNSIQDKVKNGQ